MYNRLFTKILDSSIWLESNATRIVWVTLLAAMDQDGVAHFSAMENLSARARVSLAEVEKAVKCFLEPDKNSGDPDNEGRRIERIPGGFIILNAGKYRDIFSREIQREQTRLRVARHRSKNKPVTQCNDLKREVTQSEAVSVSEAKHNQEGAGSGRFAPPTIDMVKLECAEIGLPEAEAENFMAHHEARGWMLGKVRMRRWQSALITWRRYWQERVPAANGHAKKPLTVFEITKIIEAKQSEATQLQNRHFSAAPLGGTWNSEPARATFKKLRGEIKELTSKLGGMA